MSIYQDYGYGYSDYGSISTGFAVLEGFLIYFIVMMIIMLVVSIVMCIAQWKIFKKAGQPGWYSLIPIFNMWMFLKISGLHGWLSLIPFANSVAMLIASYKLAIKFGKSPGFAVCTVFFSVVCLPIIAFDKSTYESSNTSINSETVDNNTLVVNNTSFQPIQPVITNDTQQVVTDVQYNNNTSIMQNSASTVQSVDYNSSNILNNSINNNLEQQNVNNVQPVVISNNIGQNSNVSVMNTAVQNTVDNNLSNNVNNSGLVDNSVKICSNCQNVNPSNTVFCVKCGNKL